MQILLALTLLAVSAYAQQVSVVQYFSDSNCTTVSSEVASKSSCTPSGCLMVTDGVYLKTVCQTDSYTPTSGLIGYTSYSAGNCDPANLSAGTFGKPGVCTKTGTY